MLHRIMFKASISMKEYYWAHMKEQFYNNCNRSDSVKLSEDLDLFPLLVRDYKLHLYENKQFLKIISFLMYECGQAPLEPNTELVLVDLYDRNTKLSYIMLALARCKTFCVFV